VVILDFHDPLHHGGDTARAPVVGPPWMTGIMDVRHAATLDPVLVLLILGTGAPLGIRTKSGDERSLMGMSHVREEPGAMIDLVTRQVALFVGSYFFTSVFSIYIPSSSIRRAVELCIRLLRKSLILRFGSVGAERLDECPKRRWKDR